MIDRRSILKTALAGSAISVLPACSSTTTISGMNSQTVETNAGRVKGYTNKGILVFKGIPYGADTSGSARFFPPKPATPCNASSLTPGPATVINLIWCDRPRNQRRLSGPQCVDPRQG